MSSPRLYRIKTGDSLAKIANRFGVTVQDILDANPDISNPNNIFVGQIIVVPVQVPRSNLIARAPRAARGCAAQRGARFIAVILPVSTRKVASRCCEGAPGRSTSTSAS